MRFDTKRAEATIVEILDEVASDRVVGLGFRLRDDVIATACRCLPRRLGKVLLVDPDQPEPEPVFVRVRHPGSGQIVRAPVIAADPCSNFALLSVAERLEGLEPARLASTPFHEGSVFICTHERRWVEGPAASSIISLSPANRLRTRTSGAPVFDPDGQVVGLVGYNDVRVPEVTMCALADHLPAWALRQDSTDLTIQEGRS